MTVVSGTTTYTWNARDQLVSLSGPGVTASFQYDAVGRRKSKTVNSTTTNFLYDGLHIVQELNGTAPIANLLTSLGIDEVLQRTDSAGSRAFLVDGLGSTLALTDAAGLVQSEYTYEPFGKTTNTGVTSTNAFKYTGREDDGTGLYYYRARYYHPALQRFISQDPIGFLGGATNLYGYVLNDPLNWTDPFGLINCTPDGCDGGIGGGIGGGGMGGFGGGGRGGSIPPASAPAGRSGNPLVPPNPNAPARNAPGSINGRPYAGHAFDQMQNRGIPPSAVENAINKGQMYPGRNGRTQCHDPVNDITVIIESDGTVVTVRPGGPSGLGK